MVNIVVHGHDPSVSEMVVFYANDPEMIALAKSYGAKGINVVGVCCTGNEVAMRLGIPMAGNFLCQENVVLTGACEAVVVDVQCIFPALGPLSKCFHTKFITTSPIAMMPDSDFIEFHEETAAANGKAIVRMAVENFKNRDWDLVNIPNLKTEARVGYSVEAIVSKGRENKVSLSLCDRIASVTNRDWALVVIDSLLRNVISSYGRKGKYGRLCFLQNRFR